MSDAADTGLRQAGTVAILGLLWLLLPLAVIRSTISAELASTAIRLHTASSGGEHGAHQV
jgi:hypothetical protein